MDGPVRSFRPSVCLAVRLSVSLLSQCSCHRTIMKFSGVITIDRSDVLGKGQDQRSNTRPQRCPIVFRGLLSNFKVTWATKSTILTLIGRFRVVTPVWIHRCLRNEAQSLGWHGRGAILFHEVIRQISRSHGPHNLKLWIRFEQDYEAGRRYQVTHNWLVVILFMQP